MGADLSRAMAIAVRLTLDASRVVALRRGARAVSIIEATLKKSLN